MVPLFGNLTQIIFEQYPPETMRPGDLYWYNDCHGSRGGVSHSPDMVFAAPVFHRGKLVAFSQTWGHFWDIGGMRAGSISPDATEIFHEGIIVPAVRIYREGVLNDEAFRIFLRNSRFPDILQGDIRAVLAGCRLGERRVLELFDRFGAETVLAAWALFEAAVPRHHPQDAGVAHPRRHLRERGRGGRRRHERPLLPRAHAPDQGRRPDQPRHAGERRPGARADQLHHARERAQADPGHLSALRATPRCCSTTGPRTPSTRCSCGRAASCSRTGRPRSATAPTRWRACSRTCSRCWPWPPAATSPAPNSVYNIYFLRGFDRARNEFFLCSDGVAVGYGARPFADGLDAIYYVAQKNYPAEFMEMVFPLRLRRYALHQDSGGPGRFRGGAGVVRELELLADEAVIAIRQDNILFPPAGVNGGHAGRPGSCLVNPGRPDERRLAPMSDGNVLRRGDVVRLATSGGGGWGHPFDRPLDRVRRDVLAGVVSVDAARADYGVVIDADGTLDLPASEALRAEPRGPVRMFHRNGYFGPLVETRR